MCFQIHSLGEAFELLEGEGVASLRARRGGVEKPPFQLPEFIAATGARRGDQTDSRTARDQTDSRAAADGALRRSLPAVLRLAAWQGSRRSARP